MSDPESFFDRIKGRLDDLTTLTITTVVGDLVSKEPAQPQQDNATPGQVTEQKELMLQLGNKGYTFAEGARVIYSSIDLVDGDITTIMHEDYTKPALASLRQYHQAREQEGRDIIDGNIETLKALVKFVDDRFLEKEPKQD